MLTRDGNIPGIDDLSWQVGPVPELAELTVLVRRCLERDGGLPLAAERGFLQNRWRGERATGVQARTGSGELLAAGAVRPGAGGAESIFCGLVDPAARGLGLGGRLLDRGLAVARGGTVTVETESWTPEGEALFASRGLHRVFLEEVLRFDLAGGAPGIAGPDGMTLEDWSGAGARRFFEVYQAAFRERPGFPGWSADRWVEETVDDDFRPAWSLLAALPGVGDAGFLTAAYGWIVQVGVVPAARGRGVGAALVTETLRRMRADGAHEAWLDVTIDNPARALYRRLGFALFGSRGRYRMGLGS